MLKNIGSNWFLLVVTVLCTFFLVPFNLRHLGEEQYGLWLLIASLTGYLSLLQLGVPMATVRHMTQAIANNDQPALNRLVASCAGLYLGLGAVAALIGLPLLLFYETAFALPPEMRWSCRWAFVLALLNVGLGFIAQLPYAIMNSYQDFVRVNLLSSMMVLLRTVLNVVLILRYPSLLAIAALQVLITALEMVILWGIIFIYHKNLRVRLSLFSFAAVREVLGFSVYVLLLSVGGQLMFQTDALVIGWYLGAEKVPVFSVGNNLVLYLMQFIVGIASVIMPLATSLQTQGRFEELRAIFFKWSKVAFALTGCAGLYLIVFGPDFLACWIGGKFEDPSGRVLRILMVSYLLFLPIRGVGLPVLMGLGKVGPATVAFLGAGVLNLVLSLVLVQPLGLDGVALGTTIPNLLLAAILLSLACAALDIPVSAYLLETLPRALLGFAMAGMIVWGWQYLMEPRNLIELGIAGVVTVLTCGLIWIVFVFRNDPHVSLPVFSRFFARRPT